MISANETLTGPKAEDQVEALGLAGEIIKAVVREASVNPAQGGHWVAGGKGTQREMCRPLDKHSGPRDSFQVVASRRKCTRGERMAAWWWKGEENSVVATLMVRTGDEGGKKGGKSRTESGGRFRVESLFLVFAQIIHSVGGEEGLQPFLSWSRGGRESQVDRRRRSCICTRESCSSLWRNSRGNSAADTGLQVNLAKAEASSGQGLAKATGESSRERSAEKEARMAEGLPRGG